MHTPYIAFFKIQDAPFHLDQTQILPWIALMHAEAETLKQGWSEEDKKQFEQKLSQLLHKLGLGPEKIQRRRMFFDDFFTPLSSPKLVYDFSEGPKGKSQSTRSKLFLSKTTELLEKFYENISTPPSHLIHTTCTGYNSPSAAQRLVAHKNWGNTTTVTHAYHMGCYASIPSIRLASSLVKDSKPVDVVHTEFCTLHMDPSNHTIGQLVIESLFADGAIKYSLFSSQPNTQSFKLLKTQEEIIPDTIADMRWDCSDFGFNMHLSKDIPRLISEALIPFLQNLYPQYKDPSLIYAIHPGGPKIIDKVAEMLGLKMEQYAHSLEILKRYGNMSSATLPHVWEKILQDEAILPGQKIVSLAFGPGLTIAGALFEKCEAL